MVESRIAIGNYDLAGGERGPEFFANVLRAIGKDQQQFRGYVERNRGIEKNRANRFAGARAARLMGDRYAPAALAQRVAQDCGLGGLATSFDAFERDEYPGCHQLAGLERCASLSAKIPARQLRLKEREDAGGQRQIRTERNFGAQNRDVRFLRIGHRVAQRSGCSRAAAA